MSESSNKKETLLEFIKSIRGILLILAFIAGIILFITPSSSCLSYYYENSGTIQTVDVSNVYTVIFTGTLTLNIGQTTSSVSASATTTMEIFDSSPILLLAWLFSLLSLCLVVASFVLILLNKDKIVPILGLAAFVLLFVGGILYLCSMNSIFNIVVGEGYSHDYWHLGSGAIASGVVGIIAALLCGGYAILSLPSLKGLSVIPYKE